MLRMIIDVQTMFKDRTFIVGDGQYDTIPAMIKIENRKYKVIGISPGVMSPRISLEIERTEEKLNGKIATSYYDYSISSEYDRVIFTKLVSLLTKRIDNIEKSEYLEDPLDGDQFQIFETPDGKIKVINDFMAGALWIESEVNLDGILKEFDYA